MTREGTLSKYLGIKFEKNLDNGSINITQKGLINKIIETAGMTDCNPNWTPALTPPLGTDPDRQDHHQVLALDLLQKNDREANWSAQLGRLC